MFLFVALRHFGGRHHVPGHVASLGATFPWVLLPGELNRAELRRISEVFALTVLSHVVSLWISYFQWRKLMLLDKREDSGQLWTPWGTLVNQVKWLISQEYAVSCVSYNAHLRVLLEEELICHRNLADNSYLVWKSQCEISLNSMDPCQQTRLQRHFFVLQRN